MAQSKSRPQARADFLGEALHPPDPLRPEDHLSATSSATSFSTSPTAWAVSRTFSPLRPSSIPRSSGR